MPYWILTIVICVILWVLGSAVIVIGARWIDHREPN